MNREIAIRPRRVWVITVDRYIARAVELHDTEALSRIATDAYNAGPAPLPFKVAGVVPSSVLEIMLAVISPW